MLDDPLSEAVMEKASKYKDALTKEQLPFVVSVATSFDNRRDLEELRRAVVRKGEGHTGLFQKYPTLVAVTLAQPTGIEGTVHHLLKPKSRVSACRVRIPDELLTFRLSKPRIRRRPMIQSMRELPNFPWRVTPDNPLISMRICLRIGLVWDSHRRGAAVTQRLAKLLVTAHRPLDKETPMTVHVRRQVYVISDLHLGGHLDPTNATGRGFRIFTHGKELAAFINALANKPASGPDIELVINGDVVDFLAEKDPDSEGWSALKLGPHAPEVLNNIVGREAAVFEALTALLRAEHRLTLLLGNHDVELSFPEVRARLEHALHLRRFIVSIGSRWFLATAAHTFPTSPSGKFRILSENRLNIEHDPMPGFLKSRRDLTLDIGYLELDPDTAGPFLGPVHAPCPIEQLATVGIGPARAPIALVGSPSQFLKVDLAAHDIVPKVMTYLTSPLPHGEWPAFWPSNSPPLSPDRDIMLEFTQHDAVTLGESVAISLTSPEGYSGGGIWDLGLRPKQLWSPSHMKLIGIQSSWHDSQRICRSTQVIHWIRMVHADYPDLRSSLDSLFPALNP